jgi:uncharacterized protein (TIGR03790 family)
LGRRLALSSLAALAFATAVQAAELAPPRLELPPVGLRAQDLALIVNAADPASVELGRYYAQQRKIGADRVIQVSFPPGQAALSIAEFDQVQATLRAKVPAGVQAYALAWTLPYRVDCMSITSAFAFGFDPAHCTEGCRPTRPSPYFDSATTTPSTDFGLRPAMLLAGKDLAAAKAMIDRGVRSDNRWPEGTAYLLSTSNRKRNVRAANHDEVRRRLGAAVRIQRINGDELDGQTDVLFYFTGVQHVAGLDRNRFVDGAMADHLTSLGGVLVGSSQTTVLDWLSAGATGSYGATTEPCNFLEKFPDIGVAMGHYVGGETLIEAYWKSVRMPGQGLFVGEPLARPFGGLRTRRDGADLVVRTRLLRPGRYELQAAVGPVGPYRRVAEWVVPSHGTQEIRLAAGAGPFFRVVPQAAAGR